MDNKDEERFTQQEARDVIKYVEKFPHKCVQCFNHGWHIPDVEDSKSTSIYFVRCSKCGYLMNSRIDNILQKIKDLKPIDLKLDPIINSVKEEYQIVEVDFSAVEARVAKDLMDTKEKVQKTMEDLLKHVSGVTCADPNKEAFLNRYTGVNPNKFDNGKYMAGVLADFAPAFKEIAKLGSMNNKPNGKYERGSWMKVVDPEVKYNDAFWRHLLDGPNNIDPTTGMHHDVAIAWNAIVLVWFRLKHEEEIAKMDLSEDGKIK